LGKRRPVNPHARIVPRAGAGILQNPTQKDVGCVGCAHAAVILSSEADEHEREIVGGAEVPLESGLSGRQPVLLQAQPGLKLRRSRLGQQED
jgi:hypothetical protein